MKGAQIKTKKKETKYHGNPIPVRLDKEQEDWVAELAKRSGATKSMVVRVALEYILPSILRGEVNPFEKKA